MKKVKNFDNENCIPVISSCVEWNGGSIEYLGICDGDSLNLLLWEVITKLQEIAGQDLSEFDIDSLTDICEQKAPLEVNILSILTLLKDNQICLKDFIDSLNERLNDLFQDTGVTVNLKCYAEFDNLGNSLSITRETLDQLIIDRLCEHKQRIETLEGKVILMQAQIDAINPTATVEELSYDTCLDVGVDKPTSTNVINIAQAHCDLEDETGTPTDISNSYSLFPTGSLPVEVTGHVNYVVSPANQAELLGNAYITIEYLLNTVQNMLETCCAIDCNDIELGFLAEYDGEDNEMQIAFTWGAGTVIPAGFEDCGSTILFTDGNGNSNQFNIEVSNDSSDSFSMTGLDTLTPITINITTRLCNDGLTCQKCLIKTVTTSRCEYCTYTAGGTGSVAIIYTVPDTVIPV